MVKRLTLLFLISTLVSPTAESFALVKPGGACAKVGATTTLAGKKYTCIKSGKKLLWDKGVVQKKSTVIVPDLTKVTPAPTPSATPSPSVSPDSKKVTVADVDKLPTLLAQPKHISIVASRKNFNVRFEVDPHAEGGYLDIEELGLNFENTYNIKDINNIVSIFALIPNSYREHTLRVRYFAYSKNARSSCCVGVNVELENASHLPNTGSPNIDTYLNPPKILNSPKTFITPSGNFSNLEPCKLKDGDPILDNMTVGFPLPNGRTDLTKPVKVAVLAADFADVPSNTNPENDYGTAIRTMKHFWEAQASTGLVIDIKVAQSYKRMPKTVAEYELGASLNGFKGDNYWTFIQAVIDAYDNEVDFKDVSTIVVAVPLAVTAAQIGTWVVYTQGVFKTNEGLVYNVMITGNGDSKAAPASWVHEYGHALGLTDMRYVNAAMPTDQKPEGLGIYDVMGSGNTAPDILVWSRFLTNMLLPGQIHCVTSNETSTHWLLPIEQRTDKLKGIIIPLSQFNAIVIESRRNYGYDLLDRYGEGALVYTIDTRIPYHRSPAFIQPPSRSKDLDWYSDAALQLNETVTTNGWRITVVESGDFGDVVKIEKIS